MLYSKRLTIPHNTPIGSPASLDVVIREKYITRIEVMIDIVATKGMVGVKVAGGEPGKEVFVFPVDSGDFIWKSEVWSGKIRVSEDVRFPVRFYGVSPGTHNGHLALLIIHTSNV